MAVLSFDPIADRFDRTRRGIQEALFETTIRLGVTGLSRAGKTVFITSLIENLLERDRLIQFKPAAQGRIEAAYLQPQPDRTVPRFQFETHLGALTASDPHWPESTRSISQLRLSLRVSPSGMLSSVAGPRLVHIDIVDYPGEWLLDLPLMSISFAEWSASSLKAMEGRSPNANEFLQMLDATKDQQDFDDTIAEDLADKFTSYLRSSRAQGYSALAPGRFLMPGDMEGAPVMMFAPLHAQPGKKTAFYLEMERRYEAYKSKVVLPFFKDHFAKLDRQIVLMDVLGALNDGPSALDDLQTAMAEILESFRVGENSFLSRLFTRRIDRILFAATKADHIHHTQHAALDSVTQALVRKAKERANFKGAQTRSMALASLRATSEQTRKDQGDTLEVVEGRLQSTGRIGASFPGLLPKTPASILADANSGSKTWSDWSFRLERFLPPAKRSSSLPGLPHIRVDEALEFLFGDKI